MLSRKKGKYLREQIFVSEETIRNLDHIDRMVCERLIEIGDIIVTSE